MRIWKRFVRWKNDPFRNRPNIAELMTVFLTIVIAFVGFLQYRVYQQQTKIMGSDNPQTSQLILSARISALAAEQSTSAAKSFAKSADSIDQAMRTAVVNLKTQADNTEAARKSSVEESEKSLKATIENFNAEQRPRLGLTQPELVLGKMFGAHDATIFVLNTGRTSAINVQVISGTLAPGSAYIPDVKLANWMKAIIADTRSGRFGEKNMVTWDNNPLSNDFNDPALRPPVPNVSDNGGVFVPAIGHMGTIAPNVPYGIPEANSHVVGGTSIVYGEITYDEPQGTLSHTTQFCITWTTKPVQFTPGAVAVIPRYDFCPVFNGAT